MNNFEESDKYLPEFDVFTYLLTELYDDPEIIKRINELNFIRKQIISVPKKFNKIFSGYGWIATDDLSVKLMTDALEIYHNGSIEKAEKFICNSFTKEYFGNSLRRMRAIWVFKERERLIKLAFEDHEHKRYHSLILVVLSQIDGLMFDIVDHSFFRGDKKIEKLKIKSPITGLESNLDEIARKMNKSRHKTQLTPLSFPYRNGILHGRDINYDNEIVSTKCFVNLFALRPWALFIQQNELARRMGDKYIEIPNCRIGRKLNEYIKHLMKS